MHYITFVLLFVSLAGLACLFLITKTQVIFLAIVKTLWGEVSG